MKYDLEKIRELCDGVRTSKEIAEIVGCSAKYVQAKMNRYDLPRRPRGGPTGELNGAYQTGRKIQSDGYVLVAAPIDHPGKRNRTERKSGSITEHRLVMEQKLGRYLTPVQVVDHIDGCRLHNAPDNLRLFASNGDHLAHTLRGKTPDWSARGFHRLNTPRHQRSSIPRVDIYLERKRRGDVRLQQILLAWSLLDKDSPYLLGTHAWLEKAQIAPTKSATKQALDELNRRWELDLLM